MRMFLVHCNLNMCTNGDETTTVWTAVYYCCLYLLFTEIKLYSAGYIALQHNITICITYKPKEYKALNTRHQINCSHFDYILLHTYWIPREDKNRHILKDRLRLVAYLYNQVNRMILFINFKTKLMVNIVNTNKWSCK